MKYSVRMSDYASNNFAFPCDFLLTFDEVGRVLRLNPDEVAVLVRTGNLPYPDGEGEQLWHLSEVQELARKVGDRAALRALIDGLKAH